MTGLYHLYLLKCQDDTVYCGIAKDVTRRLGEHNSGRRGAKYTRSRRPVTLMASWPVCCLSCALKTERRVKSISRDAKLQMVERPEKFASLCKRCPKHLLLIQESQLDSINPQKESTRDE